MTDIESIKNYLSENLSKKRYKHSLGVADEAVCLAKHYGADTEKAYIAGIVHDVAKEIPTDTAKKLLKEKYGVNTDFVMDSTPKLLHGPLGACIAQSEFSVYDPEIIDAVKYHTTAKADMSLLTKVIYIADYIEPNRDFDGVDELRRVSYEDIDEALLIGLNWTIEELMEKKSMFHPDTVHARNYLLKQLKDK